MENRNRKRKIIQLLPIYGCIATGLIYAAIGVIALLSFFKVRHGGADESSLLTILNDYVVGKIFIWIILAGTVSYIIWRFYEAVSDPYEYGKNIKGIIKRTGIALSTVADMLIVYAAIRVLFGNSNYQPDGTPEEEQQMAKDLMMRVGSWLVIVIGGIYLVTAIIQFGYGITKGYKERVNIEHFSAPFRVTVHVLAWAGYFARGVILGITGYFFVKAGTTGNARHVVNTDKSFDFIGDHVGHPYFIAVAVATICYGLFMLAQGFIYDTDKD